MFSAIAPQISSQQITSSSSFTVEQGESLWVYGIVIAPTVTGQSSTVQITLRDGSTIIHTVTLTNESNIILKTNFKISNGLSFTSNSTTPKRVTVFHSKGGV